MSDWQDYHALNDADGVTGDLRVYPALHSPQLENDRDILVWLPPSYHTATAVRYPVLYMHDGQNLFDAETSFAGEWGVDEQMTALAAEGIEALVVGITNKTNRMYEFNPFTASWMVSGGGEQYLQFVTETVKPLVDAHFRTLPDRDHTALIGSSMGGLISLYGYFTHTDVFGLCGALSPSAWFGKSLLTRFIEQAPTPPGRIYLDIGTQEGDMSDQTRGRMKNAAMMQSLSYIRSVRRVRDLLKEKGYGDDALLYTEDFGGIHNEAAWGKRFPAAARFLLDGKRE